MTLFDRQTGDSGVNGLVVAVKLKKKHRTHLHLLTLQQQLIYNPATHVTAQSHTQLHLFDSKHTHTHTLLDQSQFVHSVHFLLCILH